MNDALDPRASELENPFPGIRPFKSTEAELFFGRDQHVHDLLDSLRRRRFVAVMGNSGTGKSSLVRAGVLPQLEAGFNAPEGGSWRIATTRPGGDPIGTLAAALAEESDFGWAVGADAAQVLKALKMGGLGLVEVARRAEIRSGSRFLILVDQFEELFGFLDAPTDFEASDEALAFVRLLMEATAQPELPIYVIITMRSEFIGHCSPFPGLPVAINRGLYLVPELNRDQLRQVIEGPIAVRGAEISPSLVNEILNDAHRVHDRLPLLGHVLNGLWKQWRTRCSEDLAAPGTAAGLLPIDLHDYNEIGGMEGSLNRRMEWIYDAELDEKQRAIAEQIFRHLTAVRADGTEVRRPTELRVISATAAASEDEIRAVIDVFRRKDRSFLMPPLPEEIESETTIDIAHEVIFRRWPRLNQWMEQEAADTRLVHELERDSEAWELSGRARDHLYSGARLARAERWRKERADRTTILEGRGLEKHDELRKFLATSVRGRWLARGLRAALGVIPILAVGMWYAVNLMEAEQQARIALQSRQDSLNNALKDVRSLNTSLADRSERLARSLVSNQMLTVQLVAEVDTAGSRQIAANANRQAEGDPELGILLAFRALEKAQTREAMEALHEATRLARFRMQLSPIDSTIYQVVYSPDGARLAAALADGTARIWDVGTGAELLRLDHRGSVRSVAFNADGTLLASGGEGGSARIWSAWSGSESQMVPFGSRINALAFSPDGSLLAIGGDSHSIELWSIAASESVRRLETKGVSVSSLSFSPDGGLLAMGGADGRVRLWHVSDGVPLGTFKAHEEIFTLAFSPSTTLLATVGRPELEAIVWDTAGTPRAVLRDGHTQHIRAVAFSPDGSRLVTAGDDLRTVVWDWEDEVELFRLLGHSGSINTAAFSPDGRGIATGASDGTLRLSSTEIEELLTLRGHGGHLEDVDFNHTGGRAATASVDGTVRIWDVATGSQLRELRGHRGEVEGVAFSPDGDLVASAGVDSTARLWNTSTGEQLRVLRGHRGRLYTVDFSQDGRRLVTSSADSTVMLWDAFTGDSIVRLEGHTSFVHAAVFSPNGAYVASGSADSTAMLWDAFTGDSIVRLVGHGNRVIRLAFSPDGTRLATTSWDETGRLWEVPSGELLMTFLGHSRAVYGVDFNPRDGTTLATASADGTARVWDTRTGRETQTIQVSEFPVFGIKFKPDGSALLLGTHDDVGKLVAVDAATLYRLARGRLSRSLAPLECRVYLWLEECPARTYEGLMIRADSLARAGDREAAVPRYAAAGDAFPGMRVDGEAEADQLIASRLIARARFLAGGGDIIGAREFFVQAAELVASLPFDPLEEARHLRGQQLAFVAETHVALSDLDGARAAIQELHAFDAHLVEGMWNNLIRRAALGAANGRRDIEKSIISLMLDQTIDPDVRSQARSALAEAQFEEGVERTKGRELDSAKTVFRRAIELDPDGDYRLQAASELATMGQVLAENGGIVAALEFYEAADDFDRDGASAFQLNDLCWFGGLGGFAREVLDYCERAVEEGRELGNPWLSSFRDSRGVALVEVGEYGLAVEDFRAFVDDETGQTEVDREQRRQWIADLEADRNPLTREVLSSLR